jgi:hypothetical protein
LESSLSLLLRQELSAPLSLLGRVVVLGFWDGATDLGLVERLQGLITPKFGRRVNN